MQVWSAGFLHLAGADALGADISALWCAVLDDTDLLQVRIEPAPRGAVGVAAVISVTGFLAAYCAYFRHDIPQDSV